MNYQEFSKRVKEKYPEYKEINDLELAQLVVKKYPEYDGEVEFPQNPQSAVANPSALFDMAVNSGAKVIFPQSPQSLAYNPNPSVLFDMAVKESKTPYGMATVGWALNAENKSMPEWLKRGGKAVMRGGGGIVQSTGNALEWAKAVADKIGLENKIDDKETERQLSYIGGFETPAQTQNLPQTLQEAGSNIRKKYEVENPNIVEEFIEAGASSIPLMLFGGAIGAGGKLLGLSAKAAMRVAAVSSAVLEGAQNAGDVYKTVLSKGKSEDEAVNAGLKHFAFAVPLSALLNRLGIFEGGKKALTRFFRSGAGEGLEELQQDFFGSIFSGEKPEAEQLFKSFVFGGLLGGGTNIALSKLGMAKDTGIDEKAKKLFKKALGKLSQAEAELKQAEVDLQNVQTPQELAQIKAVVDNAMATQENAINTINQVLESAENNQAQDISKENTSELNQTQL